MHQITKLKWFSSGHVIIFAQSIEAKCSVENEYVTSEWSTSVLSTKVWIILEIWWYYKISIICIHSYVYLI